MQNEDHDIERHPVFRPAGGAIRVWASRDARPPEGATDACGQDECAQCSSQLCVSINCGTTPDMPEQEGCKP